MDKIKPLFTTSSGLWPSKRLLLSYLLDWLVIFLIAGVGGIFNYVSPYHRPFSLLDLTISYPLVSPEKVPVLKLLWICGFAPAVIIAVVALLIVPGPRHARSLNRAQIVRLKFWEFEKGWAGFCLSIAVAFFITQAMKNLFGKPRPDMLARCMPDLENIAAHVVGGYGAVIDERWQLVDVGICTSPKKRVVDDGFRSFPSGHASFSWSSMLYLSFFLCSKFAIAIPYLPTSTTSNDAATRLPAPPQTTTSETDHPLLSTTSAYRPSTDETQPHDKTPDTAKTLTDPPSPPPLRNTAAAPPVHLLILAALPLCVAVWICSTRYAEFYHFGFDLIGGSLIGALSAWFAFRWYHLPIRSGRGWAWGARSRKRAFGIGVGTAGYVGEEGWGVGWGVGKQKGREEV